MKIHDELKEEAAQTGNIDTFEKYKEKRNDVSSRLKQAESEHHKSKFIKSDLSSAGKVRNRFLEE